MPSVVTKPQENGASSVPETSLQAAIAIVEKKVRNLEKRKGKLDSYRDLLKRGKPLNEDQQAAVDKYEEVISTLDFTKELMGQFTKLAQDDARDKKKMAKKEQLEKAKEELSKVTYIMAVKEILSTILEEGVASDLKAGASGAPKVSEEQLSQLQQFAQLVTPDREVKDKGSFDKQVNSSAEHLINLADKKSRTVVGTTYVELNTLISTIRESGYIEAKWARDSAANTEADVAAEADYDTQDTQDEDDDNMPETEPINEKIETTNGHAMLGHDDSQNDEPMPVFPSPPQQQNQQQIPAEASPQHMQQQHQPPQQIQQQQPVQQVPVPEPSFNFLQESQIDLESPHMDPAVVMVRPAAKRPPGNVQAHPPGMQAMVDQSRQMLEQFHLQQQQQQQHQQQQQQILMAAQQQQQAMVTAADTKFSSSRNSAFDAPIKPGTGPAPGMANGLSGPQTGAPPFTQTSPAERQAPNTDPRAPRVPDGTPQHSDPSPNKPPVYNSAAPIQPSGYAAAAGGSTNVKQADTEIGTWRPEGATNGDDEDEDGRHGGDKSRRGRGGGGGRGFGGGRRGDGRGYSRGRGDRGDRGYRGGRGGGGDRRQYDDRDRRDDRPRGSGGRGGGFRGGRGGPRGGQNGYRE